MPKNIILNSTHDSILKIPNKREFQPITFSHSSDIEFQDFMNLFSKIYCKTLLFFSCDSTLASDNPSRFRKS